MALVKLYVLLADRGTHNPQNGTLSLLNVGWAVTQLRRHMNQGPAGPGQPLMTAPYVVVVFMEAELGMCNKTLTLEMELLTEDGDVVENPWPRGRSGRPAGAADNGAEPAWGADRFPRPRHRHDGAADRPAPPARYLPLAGEGKRQGGRRLVSPFLRGCASSAGDVRVLGTHGVRWRPGWCLSRREP